MARTLRIGPHTRAASLARLDGRSEAGRYLAATRRELIEHVGGRPSATQKLMIERACSYRLRLALLDAKAIAGAETVTDARWYGHWSAGLARIMRDLGLGAAPPAPRTLAEHVAAKRAGGP